MRQNRPMNTEGIAARMFPVVKPQPDVEDVRKAVTEQSAVAKAETYAQGLIRSQDWKTPQA